LKQHPEIGLKLVQVEAMAKDAISKNPQLAIDAYIKRLQLSPEVAKATVERECCGKGIPSFSEQLDPMSPYSMTSKEGGLVAKLKLASEALFAVKAIAEPIPLDAIQNAIDPSFLREYMRTAGK
jgi:NitT/TauT family transport system substrate-binding protein